MTRRLPGRAALMLAVGGVSFVAAQPLVAQGQQRRAVSPQMREASQLDLDGKTTQARVILHRLIDTTSDPADRADAQRAMAMSYAFDGDCANTGKYEQMVIDYWHSREEADPANAYYQQGEMADEAGRVCIDAGDLDAAERWYRKGYELGVKEPPPETHRKALWDFRLAHALGRLAARRGDSAQAHEQIAAARRALDSDTVMAAQQERFYPYLVGYVALYMHDLSTADAQLTKALALKGNENDPFLHYLLGTTEEQLGRKEEAAAHYRNAFDLAKAHNPPSAFVRRVLRKQVEAAGQ